LIPDFQNISLLMQSFSKTIAFDYGKKRSRSNECKINVEFKRRREQIDYLVKLKICVTLVLKTAI
jgi:hypothetical protein